MAFSDYYASTALNTTIGEGIYIGPNMARNDVREALQQLAADGRGLSDEVLTLATSGVNTDGLLRADMASGANGKGAELVGTRYGRDLDQMLVGLPSRFRDPAFAITTIKAFGDSFSLQPNPHTSGDSMVKKYATLLGVASPTITATSGNTSADGQTGIFTSSVAVTDHTVLAFGQNDAQFLGTATDKSARMADLGRIHLANLAWLAKAAGTNKIAAGSATAGQLAVSGTWTADADLAGAFKSSTAGHALQATFTNCRYGVLLYKAKIGSTGRFYVKLESDDTNKPVFGAAPESAWVPTNTSKTWAVMARVFDFGAKLPTAALQVAIDASTGGGEVSVVGFIGFSGDVETGPLLGVADVSRRGSAGYATAAGSDVNVPIVNRVLAQSMATAQGLGARIIDLPIASVIDATTGLAADAFHPSETGATAIAAAWKARMDSGAPLAGNRLDLAVQGVGQNMAGEWSPGMVRHIDRQGRERFGRLGGSSFDITSADRVIRMSTSGVLFAPVSTDGTVQTTLGLTILADGNDIYLSGGIGTLVLGNAAVNKLRVENNSLDPEVTAAYSLGSSSKQFAATWNQLNVIPTRTVANLPAAAAGIAGTRATVSDSTVAASGNFGATVAGGGANTVPVFCTGAAWIIA